MSDSVTKQVQGVCEGVMERGDWLEFHINIGRQYPVKLSTKKDEIKTIGRLAGQNMAVWTYNETEGGPNPHRPGENFKNRYLSNVVVGGALDPSLAGSQPGQTSMAVAPTGGAAPVLTGEERNMSIERQTIVKALAPMLWEIKATDLSTDQWFELVDRVDAWMGKPRVTQANVEQPAPAPAPSADDFPPQSGQDDDDIPF